MGQGVGVMWRRPFSSKMPSAQPPPLPPVRVLGECSLPKHHSEPAAPPAAQGGQGEGFCVSQISESAPYQSLPLLPISLVGTVSRDCLQGVGTICFPISLMGTVSYDSLKKGWKCKAFKEWETVDSPPNKHCNSKKEEGNDYQWTACSLCPNIYNLIFILNCLDPHKHVCCKKGWVTCQGPDGGGLRNQTGAWLSVLDTQPSPDLHSCPVLPILFSFTVPVLCLCSSPDQQVSAHSCSLEKRGQWFITFMTLNYFKQVCFAKSKLKPTPVMFHSLSHILLVGCSLG